MCTSSLYCVFFTFRIPPHLHQPLGLSHDLRHNQPTQLGLLGHRTGRRRRHAAARLDSKGHFISILRGTQPRRRTEQGTRARWLEARKGTSVGGGRGWLVGAMGIRVTTLYTVFMLRSSSSESEVGNGKSWNSGSLPWSSTAYRSNSLRQSVSVNRPIRPRPR